MLAARVNVGGIFLIGRHPMRTEQLGLHHFGEAEDRVERRAQLVAHRRQEARLGQIGALGAAARFVRIELGLLELGDERVLLRLKRNVLRRGGVQAPRDDQEIADDADRQRRRRQRRPLQTGGVENDHADDHRQHAGDERRRNCRRQKRHHGRDQQHHDNGERLRIRVARLEQRDDQIGPGRAAKRGGQARTCARHAPAAFSFSLLSRNAIGSA